MPRSLALFFLVLTTCAGSAKLAPPLAPRETLVQCLVRRQAHLYGASWCKPCHAQLALFDDPDTQAALYTDCSPDGIGFTAACEADGVPYGTVIPVWIFKDGSRLYGVRHPAVIAAVAGCPYP